MIEAGVTSRVKILSRARYARRDCGMRIALISDIHGNLPALEAVLQRLEEQPIDRIICLGDIAVGPWPSETVKRVRALDCASIVGNWDAWMLDGVPPCGDNDAGKKLLEMGSFWADQLDAAPRRDAQGDTGQRRVAAKEPGQLVGGDRRWELLGRANRSGGGVDGRLRHAR